MTVSPLEFWDRYAEAVARALSRTADWRALYCSHGRSWTHFITDELEALGQEFGFDPEAKYKEVSREYFRIDVSYSGVAQQEPLEWDLDVAIEHENASSAWQDEWIKLLHVRAGLRVIIGYDDHVDPEARKADLTLALERMARRRYADQDSPFLLVLGPSCRILEDPQCPDYEAWALEARRWVRLPERKVLFLRPAST